jgi:hypothetical protein
LIVGGLLPQPSGSLCPIKASFIFGSEFLNAFSLEHSEDPGIIKNPHRNDRYNSLSIVYQGFSIIPSHEDMEYDKDLLAVPYSI